MNSTETFIEGYGLAIDGWDGISSEGDGYAVDINPIRLK